MKPKPEDYLPIRIEGGRLQHIDRMRIYGSSRITLCQKAEGKLGRDYLLWERGIDWGAIAQFRLGYVPFGINHAFSGRIVMPVYDCYDKIVALSVRPIIDGVDPKYWNESYGKGEHLYGLNIAKYSIAKLGFAIVVEGQMDVLAMHSHGFTNTVGVLGGVFTPIHAQLLKRWTSNIVLLMDGDIRGQEHADRATEIFQYYQFEYSKPTDPGLPKWLRKPEKTLHGQLRVLRAVLPKAQEEHDPASFLVRNGTLQMRRLLVSCIGDSGCKLPKGWESVK